MTVTYGITNHVELGAATSLNSFWAKDTPSANDGRGGPWTTDTGMGDFSLVMKYRPVVQDPAGARPSVTLSMQLVLPDSRWSGMERPPGGFAPLGRLPATRFRELGVTEGVTFQKNMNPFRISGGGYYTYSAPGTDAGQTSCVGAIVNTSLAFEHFLDDERGLAYNIALVSVHTATWRADGHAINRGAQSGSTVVGFEPAIQFKLTDSLIGAVGVLFTVAGPNAVDVIYPNFVFQWYWNQGKQVIMR